MARAFVVAQVRPALVPHLCASENQTIAAELSFQAGFDALNLPRGHIHGDLFRDNVLWDDHGTHHTSADDRFLLRLRGKLLFDVAVTVNDWCLDFAFYQMHV